MAEIHAGLRFASCVTVRGMNESPIMFPYLPGGLDDFVNKVVPELQRRGLFRHDYEGKTLRENRDLPRPRNWFFSGAERFCF